MNLKNLETQIDAVIMQRGKGYLHAVQNLEETEPELLTNPYTHLRRYKP